MSWLNRLATQPRVTEPICREVQALWMGEALNGIVAAKRDHTLATMKALVLKDEQFVTDAKDERVGVLLDVKTYEHLREAEEEVAAEIKAGACFRTF